LHDLNIKKDGIQIEAYYPGRSKPVNVKRIDNSGREQLTFTVPLHRGCAMVLIKKMGI
jgi:hypothetical protein